MAGYCPASIRCFSSSPLGPPAISTRVGTQSSEANISFLIVPGLMTPGQRITIGARMPPSQVLSLPPLNGVTPPSGKVIVSAPLSVVKTTMVLLVWPICSIFWSTRPILSSICFMPASLTPQSLPPQASAGCVLSRTPEHPMGAVPETLKLADDSEARSRTSAESEPRPNQFDSWDDELQES